MLYNECFSIFIVLVKINFMQINLLCTFYFSYRCSVAFYFPKTKGWFLPVSGVTSTCQYVVIFHQLYVRVLDRDHMIDAVWVLALIAGCLHCLPGLGCNVSAFNRGWENLMGISWEATTPRQDGAVHTFWFETFVFLRQIQSLWGVAIVVGLPIQCLFVLTDLAIGWCMYM